MIMDKIIELLEEAQVEFFVTDEDTGLTRKQNMAYRKISEALALLGY